MPAPLRGVGPRPEELQTGTRHRPAKRPVSEGEFAAILAEVRRGVRVVAESERCSLSIAQRLRLQAFERQILWSLPARRRRQLAGEGRLSVYQRSVWAIAAPEEVPWVNGGVPPWIIGTLCDIVDEGDG